MSEPYCMIFATYPKSWAWDERDIPFRGKPGLVETVSGKRDAERLIRVLRPKFKDIQLCSYPLDRIAENDLQDVLAAFELERQDAMKFGRHNELVSDARDVARRLGIHVRGEPNAAQPVDVPDTGAAEPSAAEPPATGASASPPIKRPCEKALQAWRLRDLQGLTQTQIAERMTKMTYSTVSQGQVSRWLREVEAYLNAGNILPDLPKLEKKPEAIDPNVTEMGRRRTGRTRRQRDRRKPE